MDKERYHALDFIRGIAVINMVLYHAAWDFVYMLGFDWPWYESMGAYAWQQAICITFISLSGFCLSLGKKKWKRGLIVFSSGLLVTTVTLIFSPETRIIFGVLTLIGSSMLITIPLEKYLKKCSPVFGFFLFLLLFLVTRDVPRGYLGCYSWYLCKLPESWYSNLFTTYLGFPYSSFYSSDYFSLVPWLFLFLVGFFLQKIIEKKEKMDWLKPQWLKPVELIGKHSLPIYLAHQIVLYGMVLLIEYVRA